jgi:hypothetical protein
MEDDSDDKIVFLIGVQRSGTTLLRNLISQVAPVDEFAEWHLPEMAVALQHHVERYMHAEREAKEAVLRTLVRSAWRALTSNNSGNFIVDKSAYSSWPSALPNADINPYAVAMHEYYFPTTKTVIVVRDPRDVFDSSENYFKLSATDITPENVEAFSYHWARCNMEWATHKNALLFTYEDLLQNPSRIISDLIAYLFDGALDVDIAKIIESMEFAKFHTVNPHFYRSGTPGRWKLHPKQWIFRLIESRAGRAMQHFGYSLQTPIDICRSSEIRLSGFILSKQRINLPDCSIYVEGDDLCLFTPHNIAIELSGMYFPKSSRPTNIAFDFACAFPSIDPWNALLMNLGIRCKIISNGAIQSDQLFKLTTNALIYKEYRRVVIGLDRPIMPGDKLKLEFQFALIQKPTVVRIRNFCTIFDADGDGFGAQIADSIPTSECLASDSQLDVFIDAGWTPLHFAANWGDLGQVRRMLDFGVDPNEKEKNGGTALHRAADFNRLEIAEELIARGAIVNSLNCVDLETPFDIASRQNYTEMVMLLDSHRGRTSGQVNEASPSVSCSAHEIAQQ